MPAYLPAQRARDRPAADFFQCTAGFVDRFPVCFLQCFPERRGWAQYRFLILGRGILDHGVEGADPARRALRDLGVGGPPEGGHDIAQVEEFPAEGGNDDRDDHPAEIDRDPVFGTPFLRSHM